MKSTSLLSLLLAALAAAQPPAPSAVLELEKAIFAEETAGNPDQAVALYSKLIEDPALPPDKKEEALFRMGRALGELGRTAESKAAFQRCLTEYPNGAFSERVRESLREPQGGAEIAASEDIVLGLNLGADDYLTKPFRIAELHARARRLLARRGTEEPTTISFGPHRIDIEERTLRCDGKIVELQPKEFDLLVFLARRPHRAITRDQILDGVWKEDRSITDRNVDRCIRGLRKKIEVDPRHPRWFRTVHRVGYRFDSD